MEIESVRRESEEKVFHERTEIRSTERNFLEDLDRDNWQHSPKKCRAPSPARDQQQPAVDRRVPERQGDETVEQHQPALKERYVGPRRRRTHSVEYEDYAGFQQHDQLHANGDREADQRQNHQRNGYLG